MYINCFWICVYRTELTCMGAVQHNAYSVFLYVDYCKSDGVLYAISSMLLYTGKPC